MGGDFGAAEEDELGELFVSGKKDIAICVGRGMELDIILKVNCGTSEGLIECEVVE